MVATESSTFYDQHPFDWAPSVDVSARDLAPALAEFIRSLDRASLVLDIGCGPGRVLGFLTRQGLRCVGIDRSRVSVSMAIDRYSRPAVVADNVRLPLADVMADAVISDGVIHHTDTPFLSFQENCRVLKPGGKLYLAVYKPSGRYPLLYKYPGAVIRWGLEHGWSRPLVLLFAQVPYFLIHFLRSRGRRTWNGAVNLFYDYFVTPRVAFLPRELVEGWSRGSQMQMVEYQENPGLNVHSFVFRKVEQTEPQFAETAGSSFSDLTPAHRGPA
jgi:SAM-dependent methyltransferase